MLTPLVVARNIDGAGTLEHMRWTKDVAPIKFNDNENVLLLGAFIFISLFSYSYLESNVHYVGAYYGIGRLSKMLTIIRVIFIGLNYGYLRILNWAESMGRPDHLRVCIDSYVHKLRVLFLLGKN